MASESTQVPPTPGSPTNTPTATSQPTIQHTNAHTTTALMWSVLGQWQMIWPLGELAQCLVLTSIVGLVKARGVSQPANGQPIRPQNVHAVAGAVLAHSLAHTELSRTGSKPNGQVNGNPSTAYDAFSSLTAVINIFATQAGLLGSALDFVVRFHDCF